MNMIVTPHGGVLKNLFPDTRELDEIKKESIKLPLWHMSDRQLCDVELLLNGGFSPLDGFMTQADYDSVCQNMRLQNGDVWPIPIVLDVSPQFCDENNLTTGSKIVLADAEGIRIALLTVSDIWKPDKVKEAEQVYSTQDEHHSGVDMLLNRTGTVYLGGKLAGIEMPMHYTFGDLRHTPAELRKKLQQQNVSNVIAFQTRNPMHRAHVELTKRGAAQSNAHLLIHPVVGVTQIGDIDYTVRVKCYKELLRYYKRDEVTLSLLPLAMRMAGPREAVWHAIIRKNYGCNYFIVGRDHAGPSAGAGEPYYGPYEAQELLSKYSDEIGVKMVPFEAMVYAKNRAKYVPVSEIAKEDEVLNLSGTELRELLATGAEIPEWFSYPEVTAEIKKAYPPKSQRGFTIFMTGMPSSGKSTIAKILYLKLTELTARSITLLDGDIVRKMLSSELTFSKEHRNLNIRRIGFVANEITKNGGIAICAPIAPYPDIRKEVRDMISSNGGFIEAHIDTPVEVCEERDRKGLYAKARKGIITGFTGVDDPYIVPEKPELRLNTVKNSAERSADTVVSYLMKQGYISDKQ